MLGIWESRNCSGDAAGCNRAYMTEAPEPVYEEALHCVASLVQSGDVDEAADLLRNECGKAPLGPLRDARHVVLEAYVRQDRAEAAAAFIMEVLQSGPSNANVSEQLQQQSQDLVLRALLQVQQHARAAELLKAICRTRTGSDTLPGDVVFNSVLDAAVRARSYGEAWDVLELLLSCGRKADKYFVSILTKSLESSTDKRWVRRGVALVEKFIELQREDVDEIVFNSLLNVLGHVGDMQKLQQVLNKMHEYSVPPSAVTFGTVVKAYGRARDIDAVLRVWGQMRSRCLGVNPVTCGCVLDACVKCGSLDKAMAIFQEMRMQGLHKNTVLYATLIKGLAKVRDLAGAMNLYQEMRMEGVACNLVTFNSLMDVCVRCCDLQMAAFFLQDMMQLGIEPDLITFSTLIKGYSHTGEVHKALALSKELKSRGLKCDEIMYNSLIDGCAKAHKVREGMLVFEDMLQSRVTPSNITFSILVKLHFDAGQIADAFQLVEDMYPRYRCMPGRIVYTVLLRCCTQHGGPALAHGAQLLLDLASKKNSKMPDQAMVSSMISACVQHSDFETALRLVRDFTNFGSRRSACTVGLDCLKLLFEALGSHHEAIGLELLEYLRSKSMPASHCSVLQAALAEGRQRPLGWAAARAAAVVAAATGGSDVAVDNLTVGDREGQVPTFQPYAAPPSAAAFGDVSLGSPMGLPFQPPLAPLQPPHAVFDPYSQWHAHSFQNLHSLHNLAGMAPPPPYVADPYYNPYHSAAAAAASFAAATAYQQHMGYGLPVQPQLLPPPHAFQLQAAEAAVGGLFTLHSRLQLLVLRLPPPQCAVVERLFCSAAPLHTAPAVATVRSAPASYSPPLQAPSPAPKAQAAATALALTPLPAGPLSLADAQARVMATPPPASLRPFDTAEKAAPGKENTTPKPRRSKAKRRQQLQSFKDLRARAAVISAASFQTAISEVNACDHLARGSHPSAVGRRSLKCAPMADASSDFFVDAPGFEGASEVEAILFSGTSLQPQVWGSSGGDGAIAMPGLSMAARASASTATPRSEVTTPRGEVLSEAARSMLHPLADKNLPELPLIDEGNDVHGVLVLGGKGSGKTTLVWSVLAAVLGAYPQSAEMKEKRHSMPAFGQTYELPEREVRLGTGQARQMRVVLTDTPPCGTNSKEEQPLCASVSPNCSQHFNALPSWMRITMRSGNLPHYAVLFVIDAAAKPLWEDGPRCREMARLIAVLKRSQYTVVLAVTKLYQVREARLREIAFGADYGSEVGKDPRSNYESFVGRYVDKVCACLQAKARENAWSFAQGPDSPAFPLPNVTIFDVPTWVSVLEHKAWLSRTGTPEQPNLKYANTQLTRLLNAVSRRSNPE
ncbi:unnamed protein product [Polarella glacialis]|uniref:PROP1-like PPR domain-containing protein n=1 Tax=Polarella glacialis TaxID=89957 RepID=A0A813LHF3_POLGL|nr:unnamed protein product [Polarella glacialis]